MPKLSVEVTSANVKKLDLKAYNVDKAACYVKLTCGDKEVRTKKLPGLDPVFEETFDFEFDDPATTKFAGCFFMGSDGNEVQVGDQIDFLLTALNKGKPTYKALIVPGGKVEMLATAVDFGKEADESGEDVAGLLDTLDDGAGMMMDDDDEDDE
uniref:C2 domain-containing protein n=1 Tax=Tetraselmis sp. GSL018 TaxID=582737 RepID=A0A061S172_9CHLO|mmetsp:Transcript_7030/g.16871  ORF Transcript_7030/g.16871 Transcript_7030/m.16871 type:complete len:154 (+) Transcript_7030:106-567(+)|eukprot:CAMPEP_0177604740 /NCGR_PEP_ID=MMETSP0419_2-20121207/16291_1 /TAXON_ID=582737 /ORGANISM="Tetraselmis sp., Strain GSL018" /LENGTH=153 /DNA_ID=CAMNT_0019098767 /DNA_START=87 /DNA_END=548 /DNA_ORIENTATION=-